MEKSKAKFHNAHLTWARFKVPCWYQCSFDQSLNSCCSFHVECHDLSHTATQDESHHLLRSSQHLNTMSNCWSVMFRKSEHSNKLGKYENILPQSITCWTERRTSYRLWKKWASILNKNKIMHLIDTTGFVWRCGCDLIGEIWRRRKWEAITERKSLVKQKVPAKADVTPWAQQLPQYWGTTDWATEISNCHLKFNNWYTYYVDYGSQSRYSCHWQCANPIQWVCARPDATMTIFNDNIISSKNLNVTLRYSCGRGDITNCSTVRSWIGGLAENGTKSDADKYLWPHIAWGSRIDITATGNTIYNNN